MSNEKKLKDEIKKIWVDAATSVMKNNCDSFDKKELTALSEKWADYVLSDNPLLKDGYEVSVKAYIAQYARANAKSAWRELQEGIVKSLPIILQFLISLLKK